MNITKLHAAPSAKPAENRRLGVLGIGLVMEEAGKGARLVFRYPSAPAPIFFDRSSGGVDERESSKSSSSAVASAVHRSPTVTPNSSPNKKGGVRLSSTANSRDPAISADDSNSIDLFFDLPARVVSKLFRPKRPLCGQPLTLNVSGTTFCCRAELFDSQPSTVSVGEGSNHPLVLFSVIVALAPHASSDGAVVPATQFDRANPTDHTTNTAPQKRSDFAFNAIRRVHNNLARLCRVLKREELRCRYVSRQCNMLLQVRKDYEAKVGPDDERRGNEGGGTSSKSGSGMDGNISKKGNTVISAPPTPSSPKDKRLAPPPPVPTKVKKETNNRDSETRPKMTQTERREYVQNLIEIMLASNCQNTQTEDNDDDSDGDEYKQQLHGNLARELARVFHCLSKDSAEINQSPSLGANTGEGMVYINRHISVPIVPLIAEESSLQTDIEVHPYHTLLFPNFTPSEILKDLQDENVESIISTNPTSLSIVRILRQVLPITHPRRSLNEIAFDVGIPLPYVMNAVSL